MIMNHVSIPVAGPPTDTRMLLRRIAASATPRPMTRAWQTPSLATGHTLSFASSRPLGARRTLSTASSDSYATLGLMPGATQEEVKHAYYTLAMQHHPDRSEAPDAADRFAEIGAAYGRIMGVDSPEGDAARQHSSSTRAPPAAVPFKSAFPPWVYRAQSYLHRIGQRLDLWLEPTYPHLIYQHLRSNELAEALATFEEMRREGERPSHAVYEMLIRGCTIAMRRPDIASQPDHLTSNLVLKVMELWGDMEAMERKPDYLTYIELMRAFGKGGALPQALKVFDKMINNPRLLPEDRAFNTIYEACIRSGAYMQALELFDEQVRRCAEMCMRTRAFAQMHVWVHGCMGVYACV